nr:hypothetical protein [Tanacetum cinerariifolium]
MLKILEKYKAISEECKSCIDLCMKNETFVPKLAIFENSSHSLPEMLENQRLHNDRKGLGFTDHKVSTSEVKTSKTSKSVFKSTSDVPDQADPHEKDPASVRKGIRALVTTDTKLKPSMQSRTNFVQITKKPHLVLL